MPLSYRARLRRDLALWEARGLIDGAQRERIAAEALAAPGLAYLQGVLVLCLVILAATAVVAFVAANWAGMAPAYRMAVLFAANAAAVAGAYHATRRNAQTPTVARRAVADGAATLSLALAAASLALVAQTFHVPPDMPGFARTVAGLGLATALAARSGGAALVACAALLVAESGFMGASAASGAGLAFWVVWAGLAAGCLTGWLPAREANLLFLLVALTNHLFGPRSGFTPEIGPDRVLAVAALALAAGRVLAGQPGTGAAERLREGGEALARAAAGLVLLGVLGVALRTLGWSGMRPGWSTLVALVAYGLAAAFLIRARHRTALADLIVLGAGALAFATLLVQGVGLPSGGRVGTWSGRAMPFLTVWGGIMPALALVVAGHIEERRALFGWALTLVAALILAMLAMSSNLIGFAFNLLVSAGLVALTLALCRRAAHLAPEKTP